MHKNAMMAGPRGPKQKRPVTVPTVFYWDLAVLDDWVTRQPAACPRCKKSLDPTKPEDMIDHLLVHEHPPDLQIELEWARVMFHNWESLPAEFKKQLRIQQVHRLRANSAKFTELQRQGVVARIAGRG